MASRDLTALVAADRLPAAGDVRVDVDLVRAVDPRDVARRRVDDEARHIAEPHVATARRVELEILDVAQVLTDLGDAPAGDADRDAAAPQLAELLAADDHRGLAADVSRGQAVAGGGGGVDGLLNLGDVALRLRVQVDEVRGAVELVGDLLGEALERPEVRTLDAHDEILGVARDRLVDPLMQIRGEVEERAGERCRRPAGRRRPPSPDSRAASA